VRGQALQGLAQVGHRVPWAPRLLNRVANQLDTGRRLRAHGMAVPKAAESQFAVFAPAIADASAAERPLYVEFGVWQGDTILEWARRVTVPAAHFIGFDSFEGLPEVWSPRFGTGHFSTEGAMPQTDDPRVRFVKGWFDDTVPGFEPPDYDLLIVNVDGDLYTSAVTSLEWATRYLRVGDYLYFDEFHDRLHEGRAFDEFVEATGFRFEMIGCTRGTEKVLMRRAG
jgi:hypothetical protein